jgi:hypothetical protein
MRYFLFSCLLFVLAPLGAQDAHSDGHETFVLDSVQVIELRLFDTYETIPWSGSQMMIQTTVDLYGCRDHILKFFHEQERYAVRDSIVGDRLTLASVDSQRKMILVKDKECYERVTVRVFLPEDFVEEGPHLYRRKEE